MIWIERLMVGVIFWVLVGGVYGEGGVDGDGKIEGKMEELFKRLEELERIVKLEGGVKKEEEVNGGVLGVLEADLKRGDDYYGKKEYGKAKVLYGLVLESLEGGGLGEGEKVKILYRLGRIHYMDAEYEKARGRFEEGIFLLRKSSNGKDGGMDMGLGEEERGLRRDLYYYMGLSYKKLNELEKALGSFEESLRHGDSTRVTLEFGRLKLRLDRRKEAIDLYVKELDRVGSDEELLFQLGDIFEKGKEDNRAYEYYMRGLKVGGDRMGDLEYRLGNLEVRRKNYTKAIEYFQRANGKKVSERKNLLWGYAKALLKLKRVKESMMILEVYVEEYPEESLGYMMLVHLYYKMGKYKKALESIQVLMDSGLEGLKFFLKRGDILFKMGRYHWAILWYLRADEREKENILVKERLGKTYFKYGDFKMAIRNYLWLVKNGSKGGEYFQRLGESYMGYGDYNKSLKVFNHLISKFPNYKDRLKIIRYKKKITEIQKD